MANLPSYLAPLFIITALLTVILFARSTPSKVTTMVFLLLWSALFGIIGYSGFFTETTQLPPRFLFMMAPAVLIMILFFITKRGKAFLNRFDLKWLTLVHIIRLPVEIILMILAIYKVVPDEVTFEGRNFDIIMGLTALPMMWWVFTKGGSKKMLLWWNVLGIVLLMNVVIHGVLSLPYPFQQIAHDQPNIAMLYAPYLLLPGLIVPLVMFSHLAAIRLLLKK